MFKPLSEEEKVRGRDSSLFNPSRFDDPISAKADWVPVKESGKGGSSHKLVRVNPHRLEFRAPLATRLVYIFLLMVGAGLIVLGVWVSGGLSGTMFSGMELFNAVIPIVIGCAISCAAGGMLYVDTAPVVFDKSTGYFWKGRKSPDKDTDCTALKCCTRLDDIYALQLISSYHRLSRPPFYSYELNLVLKDFRRINIADPRNLSQVRADASALSLFLEKPVWDATT